MNNLKNKKSNQTTLPLLPIIDSVIFPSMIIPLFEESKESLNSLEEAISSNNHIFIVTQKNPEIEKIEQDNLFTVGTIAKIIQIYKLPDNSIKVLIEGLHRARLMDLEKNKNLILAKIEKIKGKSSKNLENEALMRLALQEFEKYAKLNEKVPVEIISSLQNIEKIEKLADLIAANLFLRIKEKQELLETIDPVKRLEKIIKLLKKETAILNLKQQINNKVEDKLEKLQKDYYLKEQLKEIQKELSIRDIEYEEEDNEIDEYRKRIKKLKLDQKLEERLFKEIGRLEKTPPLSAESGIIVNYLEWVLSLPWNKKSKEKLDIKYVEKILNNDHYGLNEVKERILEYLAVKKLKKNNNKGAILCLVGPPGVGKTSLAKSIARAMGRNFVMISLGGVRDEAEIRGHRKTYIGSMPGRIIKGIINAHSKNPIFLLDEIDKMGMDFRGDPASALLEVLDPEQNSNFVDHYLELPFDLSETMFICTANIEEDIPFSLKDRMEVISLPGYTDYEKISIARLFLLPKQLKNHGFKKEDIDISLPAIKKIIREYTREAGVRGLEKEIASICRKVALNIAYHNKKKKIRINLNNLENYLGKPKYKNNLTEKEDMVGLATGLAWTEAGGEILSVETIVMPGKGKLTLTGQLGEIMQESGKAALTYARSRAKVFKIEDKFYENYDIHVHIPEGATPKDGPSAGITMATSLISSLTEIPVRKDVAMTGEITLRGRVLPVGGLKEKILAAYQSGIKTIIIPKENFKNIDDIPKQIRKKLNFIAVNNIDEVLKTALVRPPF